jgi:hypothetical protein
MMFAIDKLVLVPDDIDLSRSPLAGHLGVERSDRANTDRALGCSRGRSETGPS